ICGLLYGFSPALVAQSLGHPQIAVAIIPPLMLLALDDILVRQHHSFLRSGALLGVLGAAQLLAGEALLAAEAIVAVAGGVLLIAADRAAAGGCHQRPVLRHAFGMERLHGPSAARAACAGRDDLSTPIYHASQRTPHRVVFAALIGGHGPYRRPGDPNSGRTPRHDF